MQQQPIKLHHALELMNRRDGAGFPVPFQIAFFTSSPELKHFKRISLPQATRCGLPVDHRNKRDLVGVRPGIRSRHDYSVNIRLIVEFNHQPVLP